MLYPALEDYALDIMIGKGPSAQSIRINLPRFTLVGATTRAGQITGPLRDRFGVLLKLELYSPDELSKIIQRSAGILDQPITPEGAYELAKRSRGTPRVANRFLKRIRDFATVLGDGIIDRDVALMGLKRMDVDALGLDELDPVCCVRSLKCTTAARWVWKRWRRPSARNPSRWKTCVSRI